MMSLQYLIIHKLKQVFQDLLPSIHLLQYYITFYVAQKVFSPVGWHLSDLVSTVCLCGGSINKQSYFLCKSLLLLEKYVIHGCLKSEIHLLLVFTYMEMFQTVQEKFFIWLAWRVAQPSVPTDVPISIQSFKLTQGNTINGGTWLPKALTVTILVIFILIFPEFILPICFTPFAHIILGGAWTVDSSLIQIINLLRSKTLNISETFVLLKLVTHDILVAYSFFIL